MNIKQTLIKTQDGDTIVEVLIAVVVISFMLVGAFTIVNKSSQQIRASQERTEANKLTTAVLERIKADNGTFSLVSDTWRCVDDSGAIREAGPSNSALATIPPYQSATDINSTFNSDCISSNAEVDFIVVFIHDSSDDTYLLTTRWDRVGGGREQLTMRYRSE